MKNKIFHGDFHFEAKDSFYSIPEKNENIIEIINGDVIINDNYDLLNIKEIKGNLKINYGVVVNAPKLIFIGGELEINDDSKLIANNLKIVKLYAEIYGELEANNLQKFSLGFAYKNSNELTLPNLIKTRSIIATRGRLIIPKIMKIEGFVSLYNHAILELPGLIKIYREIFLYNTSTLIANNLKYNKKISIFDEGATLITSKDYKNFNDKYFVKK